MKRLINKILIIVSMIFLTMMILIGQTKATLQANQNTHYKKTDSVVNWMRNIRNMEKSGEAMGLNETLNEDLTSEGESNNIDVHFLRSTEYGAVAILSASGYGNPQILQESEIKTTTGNKTGVYFSGVNGEWVASGMEDHLIANDRYYDIYTPDNTLTKVGDALGDSTMTNPGCKNWHNASSKVWIGLSYSTQGVLSYSFARGEKGIFSYDDGVKGYSNGAWVTYSLNSFGARGVAVCGAGF